MQARSPSSDRARQRPEARGPPPPPPPPNRILDAESRSHCSAPLLHDEVDRLGCRAVDIALKTNRTK